MRIYLTSALFGIIIFGTILMGIYQLLTSNSDAAPVKKNENIVYLESRIHKLEDDLASNQETVKEIKKLLLQISDSEISEALVESPQLPVNKFNRRTQEKLKDMKDRVTELIPPLYNVSKSIILQDDCIFSQSSSATVDIQMNDVLDNLPFDNPDGGVWKQGWDIQYEASQWSPENKLQVFVIPHSHCDPGWIKTFDKYFDDQVVHILDNMVRKLSEDPRRKFIYAEVSFFSMWWDKQPTHIRDQVKKLISNGQFEIVSGGWVMPDEASTHYYAMLDQMITGHQWLQENLDFKPLNSWAIDPFGLSPSMPYILKMSGIENMLIQRAHYSVKKKLARERSLEFRWRQVWDTSSSTDILCHLMPFYSYDVPHTCGPDPKVCCQFDFQRLPGSGIVCPWRVPPQNINDLNVKVRSELLLDQYRKKAQLFKTNVLLIPLGDDFRYQRGDEWDKQMINYQKIFDHLNQRSDLHVQAQWGTLGDYFRALRQRSPTASQDFFPSLSGDFFSYSDRDEHYWTGYFTTRPFYKRLDRTLHYYIRSADILLSLMLETESHSGKAQGPLLSTLREKLEIAHQNLGLFQHHDGITGTSKSHVLIDYANRLLGAIKDSQDVISQAAHSLLRKSAVSLASPTTEYFSMDEEFIGYNKLPRRHIVHLNVGVTSTFYVFNSEPHKRQQLFSLITDDPYVEVSDRSGETLLCQVDPVFSASGLLEQDQYQVSFVVTVDALSLSAYTVRGITVRDINKRVTSFGKVRLVNMNSVPLLDVFDLSVQDSDSSVSLKCGQMKAEFNEDGLLQSFTTMSQHVQTNLQFLVYESRGSGAYLFLPKGEAKPIATQGLPKVIIEGPLKSSLSFYSSVVKHQIALKNSPGLDGMAPTVTNLVDITARLDIELAMRLSTSIQNGPLFYTDINSLQMIKRTRYAKLPLQANFYPMSSQMYIEDSSHRFSLVSSTPLGVSSLKEGQIEVMLDRQLTRDDDRGLGQGIRDNVLTHHKFVLLFEKKLASKEYTTHEESPLNLPSMAAHDLVTSFARPLHALHPNKDISYSKYWAVGGDLPCDMSLVALRPLSSKSQSIALTLYRIGFSCLYPSYGHLCTTTHGKVRLNDLFPATFGDEVTQMTLTHLYEGVATSKSYTLSLQPMQLQSYKLSLSE